MLKDIKKYRDRIVKVIKNNKGSEYISEIFKFAIIVSLIISFMALPEPFIKKISLNNMTSSIVRAVETTGEINEDIEKLIEEYKLETGLNPTITWEGNFGAERRLQIRQKFSLTLSDKVVIRLAEPSFTSPINIEIPISKKVKGVSEVYWKPGQI